MPMETHRFAVDKMLGRLATWLRLIGQDTTYGSHLSRRTLVRHARREGRTILTRDRRLLRESPAPPLVLIESDHVRKQLQQVVHTCGLDPFAALLTRCSRCNDPLMPVPKAQVAKQVPPYVFATREEFMRCPRCQRVYWSATHPERIRNELRAMGFHAAADAQR